ncbi:hypothetical protein FMV2238Y02_13140 [Streptococcus canis]|uniref:Phage protein n=1 Tax=Streptococcus canis TaxID=1329 RepID=A0A3P5Y374_STRCB|nr:hypothetical protein [Streptococcus canis]MDV5974021.1 hypothetical protein [Streptococcus canis]VDC42841.1 hypothetical protein FMV2238Y02_13140 [Streptococcus canis]
MRTFSDTPKTFTFHYTFKDFDTAQVACHAILGYMTGIYKQPVIDATYHNDDEGGHANQLVLEYVEDRKLSKVFKRICDSFKDYYNQPEDMMDEELDEMVQEIEEPDNFRLSYRDMRVEQLQEMDKNILISDIIHYELELLDYADRLLSDEPLLLDSQHGYETMELLGTEVVNLMKELDTNQEYDGIHDYIINQ